MSGIKGTTLIAISVVCIAVIGVSVAYTMGLFDSDDGENTNYEMPYEGKYTLHNNGTLNYDEDTNYYGYIHVSMQNGVMTVEKNINKETVDQGVVLGPTIIDRVDGGGEISYGYWPGNPDAGQDIKDKFEFLDGYENARVRASFQNGNIIVEAYKFTDRENFKSIYVSSEGRILQWSEKVDSTNVNFILNGWQRITNGIGHY